MAFSGIRCAGCNKSLLDGETNCRNCGTAEMVSLKLEIAEIKLGAAERFQGIFRDFTKGFARAWSGDKSKRGL